MTLTLYTITGKLKRQLPIDFFDDLDAIQIACEKGTVRVLCYAYDLQLPYAVMARLERVGATNLKLIP